MYDTYGQHGSQAVLFNVLVSRHWWGSKLASIKLQTKFLYWLSYDNSARLWCFNFWSLIGLIVLVCKSQYGPSINITASLGPLIVVENRQISLDFIVWEGSFEIMVTCRFRIYFSYKKKDDPQHTIFLRSQRHHLIQGLIGVINFTQWSEVAILYDDSIGNMTLINTTFCSMNVKQIKSETDIFSMKFFQEWILHIVEVFRTEFARFYRIYRIWRKPLLVVLKMKITKISLLQIL